MNVDTAATVGNSTSAADSEPALDLRAVSAGYGRTKVLNHVDLTVKSGQVVALLGANGAGKTTLLRVAAGQILPTDGEVRVGPRDMTRAKPYRRARQGLCLVPEGRGIFARLTVRENLELQVPSWQHDAGIEAAIQAFPILGQRLKQIAGTLSGGQQQMLALSRAFIAHPKVVMLDEVSMGLAPRIVDEIFAALGALSAAGISLLLVEQYVDRALALADHVYVLRRGEVVLSKPPGQVDSDALILGYLGGHGAEDHRQATGPDRVRSAAIGPA